MYVDFAAFGLYVDVDVLILSQDCKRNKLCCAFALFFSVCFGVGHAFLSTRAPWFYVGGV